MSKDKNNPFNGFNLLKGEFPVPDDVNDNTDDDFNDNVDNDDEDLQLKDKGSKTKEELEAERIAAGDEALKKVIKKQSKKSENIDDDIDDNIDEDEDEDDSKLSSYKELIKDFSDKSILDIDENELSELKDSEDAIEVAINKTVEKRINKWVSSLPTDMTTFMEYVQNGGNPKVFIETYYGNKSWSDFDISDEDNQKIVVEESLRLSGESDEDIEDMIKEWSENGTLEKRSKSAILKLQKFENAEKEKMVIEQKKNQEAELKAQKEYWDSFKKDLYERDNIKGFKLSQKLKDQIWNSMTVVNKKTGKTAYQEAVEGDKESLLLFALQASQGFDINKLEKQVTTKVNKALGKVLKNYQKSSRDKISSGQDDENTDTNPFSGFKAIR